MLDGNEEDAQWLVYYRTSHGKLCSRNVWAASRDDAINASGILPKFICAVIDKEKLRYAYLQLTDSGSKKSRWPEDQHSRGALRAQAP